MLRQISLFVCLWGLPSKCSVVPDCKHHLSEPDLKLVWPSAKLLQAACSASNRASHIITSAVMPLLTEQYHSRAEVTIDLLSFKIQIKMLLLFFIITSLFRMITSNDFSVCAVFPQKNIIGGGAEIHPVCKTLPVLRQWQVPVNVNLVCMYVRFGSVFLS